MRTRRFLFPGLLIALLLVVGVQGCARASALGSRPAGATLHIENHNFADMNIYALRDDGFARRIGMTTGLSTAEFALPYDTFAAGSVYIVAVPIGGFGAAGSGAISVSSGQTVSFTIEQSLNMSWVTMR